MHPARQQSLQRPVLRCAAMLGAIFLTGSLGVSAASAAPTSPDNGAEPGPVARTVTGLGNVPGTVVSDLTGTSGPASAGSQPAAERDLTLKATNEASPDASGASSTDPAPTTEPAAPTDPTNPSGTPDPTDNPEPTDPTADPSDPSDPSTPPTEPTPTPTDSSKPTPAPSTSSEPTRQPSRTSTPPAPSHPRPAPHRPSSGGSAGTGDDGGGWSSAGGGRQYSNNGPRAVEQSSRRDERTGFQVDAATGFPIHPQTGLLIDPSTGRMLTRGSLEPCDFVYDFASGEIRLATPGAGGGASDAKPTASVGTAMATDGGSATAAAGDAGDEPQAGGEDQRSSTASIGMPASTMTLVLGALVALGGLWYFFVFVRSPQPKPQHRD